MSVRLGLDQVRHIGEDLAEQLAAGQPYASIEDVARRGGCNRKVMEALATAGAFRCFDVDDRDGDSGRRRDIWSAGAAAAARS